jgi:hypothetical protein
MKPRIPLLTPKLLKQSRNILLPRGQMPSPCLTF